MMIPTDYTVRHVELALTMADVDASQLAMARETLRYLGAMRALIRRLPP